MSTLAASPEVGLGTVLGVEVDKLRAQARVRLALGACGIAPLLAVGLFRAQGSLPADTLFGRSLLQTGFAAPLVVLGFAGQWALPLLISLVAGDIFAAEDQHGTWPTLLTRSVSRSRLFTAKVLAAAGYAVAAVLVLAAASLLAGLLLVGHQPVVGLDGVVLPAGHAAALVMLSWLSILPPTVGFVAVGVLLSIASRNGWVGVVGPVLIGLVMVLLGLLDLGGPLRWLLLTTGFESWHGLLRGDPALRPLLWTSLVSVGYAVAALTAARRLLLARELAGSRG